jgi:hypothetical protein
MAPGPQKGRDPRRVRPRGPHWVQLRFATGLTCEAYVSQEAWRSATLERCPAHPRGGCGVAGHGTYARVEPAGVRVPRWYCRKAHLTISLLPDFAASRLSSSLDEVEDVAAAVQAATSLETAASALRPDIDLPGAVRWTRRRFSGVRAVLVTVVGLLPELLAGVELTILSFRRALGVERVLPELRAVAAGHLTYLPPPVGFGPRSVPRTRRRRPGQHDAGPDPPPEMHVLLRAAQFRASGGRTT